MLKSLDMLRSVKTLSMVAMLVVTTFAAHAPVSADTSIEAGENLFGQCRACHQVGPDAKHQFGPILNGVMDRAAGRATAYEYSAAMTSAVDKGLFWDDSTMDEFLIAPMQYLSGIKMAFPGVADEDDRLALINYLKQFDATGQSNAPIVEDKAETEADVPRKLATEFVVPTHGELHLGRPALREEVAAWDIDIRPDGSGLPEGSGDAVTGGELYDAQCAACHGDFGEGTGRWPILAGGFDTLTEERPEKTIGSYWPYLSTVYDYVRRAMPFGNARSLSDDDVYAITAYLLYLNDLVDEDFELNASNFGEQRLPNEENFIADNRTEEVFRSVSDADVCMTDCKPEAVVVTQRARVLDVTPDE